MTLQIASVILVGTLVASQPRQAVTQMSRVSGQVIEDGTNTPVADARVFVVLDDERAAPGRSSPEVLSDRDGLTARERALQVALQAEIGAQEFYERLVVQTPPGPLRQVYDDLAKMEDGHVAFLESKLVNSSAGTQTIQ